MNDNANALRSKNAKREPCRRPCRSVTKRNQAQPRACRRSEKRQVQKEAQKAQKRREKRRKRGKHLRRAGNPRSAKRDTPSAKARRGEATALREANQGNPRRAKGAHIGAQERAQRRTGERGGV